MLKKRKMARISHLIKDVEVVLALPLVHHPCFLQQVGLYGTPLYLAHPETSHTDHANLF